MAANQALRKLFDDLWNNPAMDPSEKQELLSLLDTGRDVFLHAVAGLTDECAGRSPGSNRWSVLQCVEHVAVAEEYMLLQVSKATHTAIPMVNKTRESAIQTKGADRTKPVKTPYIAMPTGRLLTLAEGVGHFLNCRTKTTHLVHTCENLRALLTDHSLIGPVNCYEMLLLIAVHPHRHAKQIRETIDALMD